MTTLTTLSDDMDATSLMTKTIGLMIGSDGYNLYEMLLWISVLTGLICITHGLYRIRRHCNPANMFKPIMPGATIMYIVVGVMLTSLPNIISMLSITIIPGIDNPTTIDIATHYKDYTSQPDNPNTLLTIWIYVLVGIIGVISMIRGLFLLTKIGENHDNTIMKSITHIIAGLVGINAEVVIQQVQSWVQTT